MRPSCRGCARTATSWARTWQSSIGGRMAKASGCPRLRPIWSTQKVGVIVTAGAAAVKALKAATPTIPIVMASSQDAVGDGLVASLAHPGGNVTGRSVYAPELTPKRIELLKEAIP